MKKYYFCFVFKHRLRIPAWNNFIKIKKIKNYKIIDLSGPIKYFLFSKLLIIIVSLFHKKLKNWILISCDGLPFVKRNGVNMWFGGTRLKIPTQFKKYKNNLCIIKNVLLDKKNFITLYPNNLKKTIFNKNFKIVYASSIKLNYSKKSKGVWNRYKSKIIKDFTLIDQKKFWLKKIFKNLDQKNSEKIYRDLKSFLRIHVIKEIKKKFSERLVIIGDDWKDYIKNAQPSNHNLQYIKDSYSGNICLDFGSRWGDCSLHPRSIEILESGGYLLQTTQSDTNSTFGHLKIFNTFNTTKELITKINLYEQNYNLLDLNFQKIFTHYENNEKNYKTLTNIKNISKKKF